MMENLLTILFCTCLVLTLTKSQETWGECAPPCKCKWMSGKKAADCEKLNYTHIPSYLSTDVQMFDLSGNNIKHLKENSFYNVGLVNLHKLILRDSNIQEIDKNAFRALKILIEIDLSYNNLRELHPGTFSDTEKLRVILLNNNNIKVLENNLFKNLEHIQRIEISNNQLQRIGEKAFFNLTNFQALKIDSNNLTILKVSTFDKLTKLFSLDLNNNPWNCDCNLKEFRNWTLYRKLYTKPTSCNEPSYLHGKMWDEVQGEEFACPPEISSIGPSKNIEITQGDTITLWCHGHGVPQPRLLWYQNTKLLSNSSIGTNHERKYTISEQNEWSNLTIVSVDMTNDRGDYICAATSYGGVIKETIGLSIVGNSSGSRNALINHLPILLCLGIVLLSLIIFLLILIGWWCRKKNIRHDEKSIEVTSLEHHGLGEQEKSLITAVNPVVKPPRRYDAPSSVTSHGTDMTEVNRTLLDNDSVFADGVGSVIGIAGGISEDDGEQACTPEAEMNSLTHGTNYRHYPPDLLAFSGIRGASPSSQSSIIPEQLNNTTTTRSLNHHIDYDSPLSSGKYPASFKTLPHNRSSNNQTYCTPGSVILPRHGYVTIPRRPRAPSWSSGPPLSPVDTICLEPVYDNLGLRTTADGSSKLSLNKSPEPSYSMRMRPLPSTPTTPTKTNYNNTIQRSTPNILSSSVVATGGGDTSPIDRSAPEGAAEWTTKPEDIIDNNRSLSDTNGTLGRKIPPRPPPKPKKKKTSNGPLYEDEGEDGTEV